MADMAHVQVPFAGYLHDMGDGAKLEIHDAIPATESLDKDTKLLIAGIVARATTSWKADSICEDLSNGMKQHFRPISRDSSHLTTRHKLARVAASTASVLVHAGQPTDDSTIGMATECAMMAANHAFFGVGGDASLSDTHIRFVSAQAAALAAAERAAASAARGTEIGVAAADAAKGTDTPLQAAADAATQAAAIAGASRSKAADAVIAALRSFNLCPGEQSILGAEHVAREVARKCARTASPLECGLEVDIAASNVLTACSAPVAFVRYASLKGVTAVAEAVALSGATPQAVSTAVKLALKAAGARNSSTLSTAKIASRASAFAKAASFGTPVEVGTAAKEAVGEFTQSTVLKESVATEAAVRAIIRQKFTQGTSEDFAARQAREAANATGPTGSEHAALICGTAVETLTEYIPGFASAKDVGTAAKNLALSIAATIPSNLGAGSSAFLSLRQALYLAAESAAGAVLQQEIREGFGAGNMLSEAIAQAKLAVTAAPMSGRDFAKVLGDVTVRESLRRGLSTESIAKLLQDGTTIVQQSFAHQGDLLAVDIYTSTAKSAAQAMAEANVQFGLQPAAIRARCKKLLQNLGLPEDVVAHLASASTLQAVTHGVRPDKAGTTARMAIGWSLWQDKSLPAAKKAAIAASTALAAQGSPPGVMTEAARTAAISTGIPSPAAARIAMRASADAAATYAANQGASPVAVGTAAHDAVVGALAASNTSRTHALLATAVPAAVHAITVSTGRLRSEVLGSRARLAADGAMGKGDTSLKLDRVTLVHAHC